MFTYQIRPRIFRLEPDARPFVFPAECEVRLHFLPLQPFGVEAGGGRTCVRNSAAQVHFNANNGEHFIESATPLNPIDVTIEAPDRIVRFLGNTLTVTQTFATWPDLANCIEGIYFAMAPLLNVSFADAPYVERVDGMVGATKFRWELREWRFAFGTTTQDKQELAAANAWERVALLAEPRRRLFAALHYFHQACRLSRVGAVVGEFLGEVILNLAKTLEVLFPHSDGIRSMDAARAGLRGLGLSEKEIEGDFIPAIALRNQIDAGHVQLALFKPAHLKTIHKFTERAEDVFRAMLDRVLTKVAAGEFDVDSYVVGPADEDALKVVERMQHYEPINPD